MNEKNSESMLAYRLSSSCLTHPKPMMLRYDNHHHNNWEQNNKIEKNRRNCNNLIIVLLCDGFLNSIGFKFGLTASQLFCYAKYVYNFCVVVSAYPSLNYGLTSFWDQQQNKLKRKLLQHTKKEKKKHKKLCQRNKSLLTQRIRVKDRESEMNSNSLL
jgi:hypothetical protein